MSVFKIVIFILQLVEKTKYPEKTTVLQ